MPRRHRIVAIVLFWLASSGWFLQRDVWPRWRPGEPPAFTIDLSDEARTSSRNDQGVRWIIHRGDPQHRIGRAETSTKYRRSDSTFELNSHVQHLQVGGLGPIRITVEKIDSMYRVAPDGSLRSLFVDANIALDAFGLRYPVAFHVEGNIQDHEFRPRGFLTIKGSKMDLPLEPVRLAAQVNVISPLHPVNRITGLHMGQYWEAPLIDPLADSIAATITKYPELQPLRSFIKKPGSVLRAEVLQQTRSLKYNGANYTCLIIEYRGENMTVHIWVRQGDGLVLRQDATVWGDSVIMDRE